MYKLLIRRNKEYEAFMCIENHYELTHDPQSAFKMAEYFKKNGDEANYRKYFEITLNGCSIDALREFFRIMLNL